MIVLSPLKHLRKKVQSFPLLEKIELSFDRHQTQWLYVGKTISNSYCSWFTMIHDCTFIDAEDSHSEAMRETRSNWKKKANKFFNCNLKRGHIEVSIKYEEWFEPLFKVVDKAVFGHETILVHCQEGISRSSAFLAAYLINRFAISSADALFFLQTRHPNVWSKFDKELEDYSNSLAIERASSGH